MSEFSNSSTGSDFDHAVATAWGSYRSLLADHLAAASVDDQVILETTCDTDEADGRVPFVQCRVVTDAEGPIVRCEIPTDLQLPPRRRLTGSDRASLRAAGWVEPDPAEPPLQFEDFDLGDEPALLVEKAPRWADHLAAMIVTVFRDIWDVPHPSFLALHHLGTDAEPVTTRTAEEPPAPAPLDRYLAIRPRDTEHLREVIAQTVTDILGHAPERDQDGDIVLRFGSALALVIANEAAPEIQLWAPLVRDISGRTRAAELVTDLNRRWPYLRFALYEDRLRVMIDMLADPFVPQHLADMIEHLGDFLGGVDEAFATHFGGALHFQAVPPATVGDPAPAPAEAPTESTDPRRDDRPDTKSERPRPIEEPIQPSLFDDLDDQ